MGRVGQIKSFRVTGDPSVGLCEYVSAEKSVTVLKDEFFKVISLCLSIHKYMIGTFKLPGLHSTKRS